MKETKVIGRVLGFWAKPAGSTKQTEKDEDVKSARVEYGGIASSLLIVVHDRAHGRGEAKGEWHDESTNFQGDMIDKQ